MLSRSTGVIDLAILRAQTGGDAALEREVLRLYLDRAPQDLARLKAAPSTEDRRRLAHLMAGSARAVGAGEVARCAAEIEQRPNSIALSLPALAAAFDRAKEAIAAHLAAT
jgi:HPt (histidine-containing phosphotransfer) domain-containing protein